MSQNRVKCLPLWEQGQYAHSFYETLQLVESIFYCSGSGKSSLLNALSGRHIQGKIEGNVFINGKPRGKSFRRETAFVEQGTLNISTFLLNVRWKESVSICNTEFWWLQTMPSSQTWRSERALCTMQDCDFQNTTVCHDCSTHCLDFRQPGYERKIARADDVIRMLGLSDCKVAFLLFI